MDTAWYRAINHFAEHSAWLHPVMKLAALDGVGLFGVLVLVAWWYARSSQEATHAVGAVIWAALATLLAVWVNQLLVTAVARPRPFLAVAHAEVLVHRSNDYSFPSDHAVAAGAATLGLWIVARYAPLVRRLAITSTVLAVLVAFARVYVGVHYPGDVGAGLFFGALVAGLGWWALGRLFTTFTGVLAHSRLRPLVLSHTAPKTVRSIDSD
jgi:membrane-associated phospholipid phosphatase